MGLRVDAARFWCAYVVGEFDDGLPGRHSVMEKSPAGISDGADLPGAGHFMLFADLWMLMNWMLIAWMLDTKPYPDLTARFTGGATGY